MKSRIGTIDAIRRREWPFPGLSIERWISSDNIPSNIRSFTAKFEERWWTVFRIVFVYRITDDQVVVVACFHSSRNPNIWRDRL